MAISECYKVDLTCIDESAYSRRSVGCLVLNQDGKIVLQQRDDTCKKYPSCLATFGGGIEKGETPVEALVRELNEELGAKIITADIITLGVLADVSDEQAELEYLYFWHDKHGTITGCYEGQAMYYNDPVMPKSHPRVMNDVLWGLEECRKQGLIKAK